MKRIISFTIVVHFLENILEIYILEIMKHTITTQLHSFFWNFKVCRILHCMKNFVQFPRKWKYVKIPVFKQKPLLCASDEVKKSPSDAIVFQGYDMWWSKPITWLQDKQNLIPDSSESSWLEICVQIFKTMSSATRLFRARITLIFFHIKTFLELKFA